MVNFMSNTTTTVLASVLISLVVGSGIAFVALPIVYPSLQSPSANQTTPGVVKTTLKSWKDNAYISDNQLTWSLMNQTQVNFSTSGNSSILASFSAPYLVYLNPTFTGFARFQVSLVIAGHGNTTTQIEFFDDGPASNSNRELSYFPTLTFMTENLPAGTYNCSVWWKSIVDAPGFNQLIVASPNVNAHYHFDRWMLLQEIVN